MLATLLSGDGTVIGGEIRSRAQLPLLLHQIAEPTLALGHVAGAALYGLDLTTTATSTSAQLPLLLNQLVEVPQSLQTGHITSWQVNGTTLVGGGTIALSTGHIAGGAVYGIGLAPSGFSYVGPDCPMIMVEIDLDNPTGTVRSWTDVTGWVRGIQITRGGRNHELQRSDVGTATITLDNRDGRFDPGNFGTALNRPLRRMCWVRVRALYGATVYPRCQMLIESIDQQWPSVGKDATATLRCADPMKILALYDLEGELLPRETSGARVARVLALAAAPAGTVDAGISTLAELEEALPEGSFALEQLRAVEETENGQLFADASGLISFHERHRRIRDTTAVATVGDEQGEIPYRTADLALDDGQVYNRVKATTSTGVSAEAWDQESIDRYFERKLSRSLLTDDENEALNAAEYLLRLYADPPDRLPLIGLVGQNDPDRWPAILALGNSDRVLWRRRPSTEPEARTIEKVVIVERVAETVVPGRSWDVAVEVSPADVTEFWVLGLAGRSELGQTTTLAY